MLAGVPAWALAMLAEGRVGRLATADARGQPLVVPVCYLWDGERVYSAVDAKPKRTRELRRLRNIAENPRVSLLVDHWSEDWAALRWVIVEGRASVIEREAVEPRTLERLVAKYPQYRALDLARAHGPVIAVAPERILHWRADAP